MEFDREHILKLLEKHSQLEQPDRKLTQKIIKALGLEGSCALASVLDSQLKEERQAANDKIKKHLDELLSGDKEKIQKAQDTLSDFYYCVPTSGIIEP